jgi:hypothetical protein
VNQVLALNENAIKLFENKLGLIDWQSISDRNKDIDEFINKIFDIFNSTFKYKK